MKMLPVLVRGIAPNAVAPVMWVLAKPPIGLVIVVAVGAVIGSLLAGVMPQESADRLALWKLVLAGRSKRRTSQPRSDRGQEKRLGG